MSIEPLMTLPLQIQIHAAAATVAVLVGPLAIYRRKRDRLHKWAGYIWVLAMLTVALGALTIPAFEFTLIGHLGPLHGFAFLALWSLWRGMRAIWSGDVATHEAALRGLYWQGLAVAALFNFLPGRAVNRSLFPETPEAGFVVIALGGLALAWQALRRRRRRATFARP